MVDLRHRPFGWNHPYENGDDERFPRKPIVGQAIELRCVSEPSGELKKVWWCWKTTENKARSVVAERVSELGSKTDKWVAKLPAMNEMTTLEYQLFGETSTGEIVEKGDFTTDISKWIMPERLNECYTDGTKLIFSYEFDGDPQKVLIEFWQDGQENLIIDLHTETGKKQHEKGIGKWNLFTDNGNSQCWEIEKYRVRIDVIEMTFQLYCGEQVILKEVQPFEILVSSNTKILAFRRFYESEETEVYLGLGERFNAINQQGNHLDSRVFEQYRVQGENTYFPVPFFISSHGYGLFQNTSRLTKFDFASNKGSPLMITQDTGDVFSEQYVIFAETDLEEIIRKFAKFVALPALPPVWTFGLWMSSNEWYTQAEVIRQVGLMKQHQIPATVCVIEAWSDEENFYIWNEAEYDPIDPAKRFTLADFSFPESGKWPDPKDMSDQLHEVGLKLILWQIPVLKHLFPEDIEQYGQNPQHDLDEVFMIEKGYCVHDEDGNPYRVPPIWFANSLVLDVTNPEAVNWWLSKRQYLLDEIGIDGFKTDGGEHLWGEDLLFFDKRTISELWNKYPKQYIQHYYDFANRYRNGDAVTFSRAGYTGSQTAPCHWAGDQISTWEAFKAVLLAGQNLGICGVPFWGWDIGGFSGPIPSAELYLRSTAAATFAPIMQYHSEHNQHKPVSVDRTPWNIQEQTGDSRVISIFRKYANLRMSLLPYLFSEAVHSSQTGEPLFRCPFIRYRDKSLLDYPYQFLCGRHILVAPVVEPGVEMWQVYLPEGDWVDFWDGRVYSGGRAITTSADIESIPIFVEEGSILPFNLNRDLKFGSNMSNCLTHYVVLATVQFGEINGKKPYQWVDYITKQTFSLNGDPETLNKSELLRANSEKIAYFKV